MQQSTHLKESLFFYTTFCRIKYSHDSDLRTKSVFCVLRWFLITESDKGSYCTAVDVSLRDFTESLTKPEVNRQHHHHQRGESSLAPRSPFMRSAFRTVSADVSRTRQVPLRFYATSTIHHRPPSPEQILQSFANLDHSRARRTGFPEAVFAEGKTAEQVASILDDMARAVNESVRFDGDAPDNKVGSVILATR